MSKKNIRKLSFLKFRRSLSETDGVGGAGARGGDDGELRLDEEMDKVFAMSERLDVAALAAEQREPPTATARQYDYDQHRKKSYPHIHTPLKAFHVRRRMTSPQLSESSAECTPGSVTSPDIGPSSMSPSITVSPPDTDTNTIADDNQLGSPQSTAGGTSSDATTNIPEDDAGSSDEVSSQVFGSPSLQPGDRKVQFTIGSGIPDIPEHDADTFAANPVEETAGEHRRRRKSRHHHGHHRFRKYSLQEDPEWRRRPGEDSATSAGPGVYVPVRRVSVLPDEAAVLPEADIEELTSHRSDDSRGFRRHRLQQGGPSGVDTTVHIGRTDISTVLPYQTLKKMYDHSPHSVFVQLDELTGEGEEKEWKETARWIKYEEDVEEGSDRWGKPHVASLSFHSLLNLRRCLETGVVLLDLEEKDLPGVAYRVVEQMVVDELIQESDKPIVMRALLLRHRHVNEHDRGGFRFGRRQNASYTSLQNLHEGEKRKLSLMTLDERRKASVINMSSLTGAKNGAILSDFDGKAIPEGLTVIDMKEETYTSSTEDLRKTTNETILKRIPLGSEATTVLVGSVDFLDQPTIAFIRLAEGTFMPSITEVTIPVRFLFILLGPPTADLDYHEIGRSISTLMSNPTFHKIAYKADDRKALLSAINEFLDDSIVLPPGDWEQKALLPFEELKAKSEAIRKRKQKALQPSTDEMTKTLLALDEKDGKKPPHYDPLRRTKRPFGGLINDLKHRFPYYLSDFIDGLNGQCVAAAIFMYFACLSGAITFGGLMSDKTENLIGISETLVATAVAGIFFALFSGQPLVIIGSTGPLLLFDESLYQFCMSSGISYLTLRVYIGLWIAVIAIIVAAVEGSVLVKLFTRFTEEIFSALISLIYIVESFMKLIFVFGQNPLLADYCNNTTASDTGIEIFSANDTVQVEGEPWNQPNTALFCTILALGTFAIAYYLRMFRNSKFLGRNARRALGDFGVPIAIIIMVSLDYFIPQTYTEKLKVPAGLTPSNPEVRSWFIDPSELQEVWLAFAAGVPAILIYILIFMETHITELIMDKKERKLKKGSGFHVDIVLICLCNAGCGFIGAPWISAATVRSVSHISALTIMSQTHAPGEKPHVVEVKEQRMSSLLVALLVGLSVLMSPLLRLVPMSVLFGVFLYMGVSSTDGIQFFDRIKLFFMPVKHHPNASYVRRVQTYKMHLFTSIQLLCLAILWIVKSTKASLAFPFFLVLMLPFRAQLKHVFSEKELKALDGDQPDDEEDEPDFYAQAPLPG